MGKTDTFTCPGVAADGDARKNGISSTETTLGVATVALGVVTVFLDVAVAAVGVGAVFLGVAALVPKRKPLLKPAKPPPVAVLVAVVVFAAVGFGVRVEAPFLTIGAFAETVAALPDTVSLSLCVAVVAAAACVAGVAAFVVFVVFEAAVRVRGCLGFRVLFYVMRVNVE